MPDPRQTGGSIDLELPDGTVESLSFSPTEAGSLLSRWLAHRGHPLNTRCAERGQCRGCRLNIHHDHHVTSIKACQRRLADLPPQAHITVPPASLARVDAVVLDQFTLRVPHGVDGRAREGELGLAIDIGTTTVAMLLANLASGEILATASRLNPQVRFGDNVMARVQSCIDDPANTVAMRDLLLQEALHPLAGQCLSAAGVSMSSIREAVAVGNPVMLHLLCGVSPAPLGHYPFKPVFIDSREITTESDPAWDGLPPTRLLPGLGAFVGADVAAGVLASGMLYTDATCLLVDMGTNGEIVLSHNGQLHACATAAGPAFEGGRLHCGSRVMPGAIVDFQACETDFGFTFNTRPDPRGKPVKPHAIGGTAYLAFIAEARRTGLITERGRFQPDVVRQNPRYFDTSDDLGICYKVDPADAPGLIIAETDIAEIIQAKAAIAGGILALLDHCGVPVDALDNIFLSGGFGHALPPRHALSLGLLPPVSAGRIESLGNSAIGGAFLSLLDNNQLAEADLLRQRATCHELNQLETFEDFYIDAMTLGPLEEGL